MCGFWEVHFIPIGIIYNPLNHAFYLIVITNCRFEAWQQFISSSFCSKTTMQKLSYPIVGYLTSTLHALVHIFDKFKENLANRSVNHVCFSAYLTVFCRKTIFYGLCSCRLTTKWLQRYALFEIVWTHFRSIQTVYCYLIAVLSHIINSNLFSNGTFSWIH